MRRLIPVSFLFVLSAVLFAVVRVSSQSAAGQATPVLYEGARIIAGDGSAPIERGALVVQNGRITAIGRQGQVSAPSGARRSSRT